MITVKIYSTGAIKTVPDEYGNRWVCEGKAAVIDHHATPTNVTQPASVDASPEPEKADDTSKQADAPAPAKARPKRGKGSGVSSVMSREELDAITPKRDDDEDE